MKVIKVHVSKIMKFWNEWKPLDLNIKPWLYWKENMAISSSLWDGLKANITLWSPLLNKLIYWKYRNMYLDIKYTTRDTLEIIENLEHMGKRES